MKSPSIKISTFHATFQITEIHNALNGFKQGLRGQGFTDKDNVMVKLAKHKFKHLHL